jgi:uncharacterized UPF0160 family protein
VGAIYDESKRRFDHHQRGFTEVFGHGFSTKLSSAGLVYKYGVFGFFWRCLTAPYRHFGREVVANATGLELSDKKVDILWLKMYKVCSCSRRLASFQPFAGVY